MGLEVGALKEGEDVIEPLAERIVGNVAAEDVEDPHETRRVGSPHAAGRGWSADRRGEGARRSKSRASRR